MEEGQTIQWPKDKTTNYNVHNTTHKTTDRATVTLLKTSY